MSAGSAPLCSAPGTKRQSSQHSTNTDTRGLLKCFDGDREVTRIVLKGNPRVRSWLGLDRAQTGSYKAPELRWAVSAQEEGRLATPQQKAGGTE